MTQFIYYDCDNPDFEAYITGKGFTTAFGSFSDISLIAPELEVAAVNLSGGYYNAHTLHEFINVNELHDTIRKVGEIVLEAVDLPRFEYVEAMSLLPESTKITRYDAKNSLATSVPFAFRDLYAVLLDFYSPAELESFREEFGDHILWQLYDDEIAPFYRS